MSYRDRDERPQGYIHYGGVKKISVIVASGETSGETILEGLNINLAQIIFVVPNLTASHTAELKIQNEDDKDLFTSGELAESTTHTMLVSRRLIRDIAFKVETSGAESDGAVTINIYIYFN